MGANEDVKPDLLEVTEAADGTAVVELPEGLDPETDEQREEREDTEAAADGETPDEREAIRAARRARRHDRKEKHRSAQMEKDARLAQLQRDNRDLMERLARVERSTQGAEEARVSSALTDQQSRLEFAKSKRAEAIRDGDADLFAQADELYQEARDAVQNLTRVKAQASQPPQSAVQPDPTVQSYASRWIADNRWYKPNSGDPDSEVAFTIDKQIHREGWDPRTPEYWDELDNRLQKYLPRRYNDMRDESQQQNHSPRAVVTGSGRESSGPSSNGRTFTLSPERVRAMKDAGFWDDPEAKARMIRRYIAEDRARRPQ